MITMNSYNHKTREHFKLDDIQEDNIKVNKLNSTKLEQHLIRVNVGTKRRIKNNHVARLARFKAST